ncbi:MAG: hypothetical protein A3J28_05410 [Acidobacteria bacterium RIFCSPLOWO2_12_FULL_60_22]|nr:MAG: hypothetical protein A3J28_05410 [Acidobacteria bacterium RIFCSPLOWO2_12_FULL_60_22]
MFRQVSPKGIAMVVAVVAIAGTHSIRAAGNAGSLQGVVKNSSGAPVSGAFVKVINAERRLTFMAVSQAQGRYTLSNLPPGQYTVQGIGNGLQSEPSAPADVADGRAAAVDVSLTAPQAMMKPKGKSPEMSSEETGGAPPPPLPEGAGKSIVETRCVSCHNAQRTAGQHFNRERWQATIESMRVYLRGTTDSPDLTDPEAQVLLDYVAKNFAPVDGGDSGSRRVRPPADPNLHLPRIPLQGAAAKYIVVEYELENRNARPHDITADSKGIAWIGEGNHGYIGRFDPSTFTYTRIPVPPAQYKDFRLNAIQIAPQDQIWVVDGGPNRRWIQFDTKTREFNVFEAPKPKMGIPSGNTFRVLPDGSVWLSANTTNQILRLDPATKKYTAYDVPAGVKAGVSARPYGMAVSGDGKLWFAENMFDIVGRLDPATGKIDEFPVPAKDSSPRRMGTDAQGNVWLGLYGANKLVKIDYRTTKMFPYTLPTENSGPYSVSVDLKHNLVWVSEQWSDKLARFDPKTETFVEFPLPRPDSDVRRIEVDQSNPNRVWWSGSGSDRLGYVEVIN